VVVACGGAVDGVYLGFDVLAFGVQFGEPLGAAGAHGLGGLVGRVGRQAVDLQDLVALGDVDAGQFLDQCGAVGGAVGGGVGFAGGELGG
jgi:hypothetical protein